MLRMTAYGVLSVIFVILSGAQRQSKDAVTSAVV
jgi:hypothetical protein